MTTYFNQELLTLNMAKALREVTVGLYYHVSQHRDAPKPPGRIIASEPFTKSIYGEAPEPGPDDYYWCEACQDKHLRECFNDAPPLLGTEPWVHYRVELPPEGGYQARDTVLKQEKAGLKGERIKFTNEGDQAWDVGGFFLLKDDTTVLYDDGWMSGVNKPVPPGVTVEAVPEIRISDS